MSDDKKPAHKYTVANLAEDLGVQPATARISLRKAKIEKSADGVYGWNSQADYKAVLKQLKGDSKEATATPAKKPAKAKAAVTAGDGD